jgi:hypothetical protein
MITFPSLNANQSKINRFNKYTAYRDFVSGKTLNPSSPYSVGPNLFCERNSSGSYFDISGNMQFAAVNTPRFSYDPINTGENNYRGLLVEDGRYNYLTGCNRNGTHSFPFNTNYQITGLTPETTYTFSFYTTTSRSTSATSIVFLSGYISNGSSINASNVFTWTGNNVKNTGYFITGSNKKFGERTVFVFSTATGTTGIQLRITNGNIFYPQLENKADATSFIPTENFTRPVQRNNEKIYFSIGAGALNQFETNFYNQGPGTIYFEGSRDYGIVDPTNPGAIRWIVTGDVNQNQSSFFCARNTLNTSFVQLQNPTTNYNRPRILVRNANYCIGYGGANVCDTLNLSTDNVANGQLQKTAVSYSDISGAFNGASYIYTNGTGISASGVLEGAPPTDMSRIYIASSDSNMLNGYIKKFAYWPFILSTGQLYTLTTGNII